MVKEFLKLAGSIFVCELVGLVSTPFTISAISSWYVFLHKPFFSPPNWVFGPVWTALYFLMGVSVYLILRKKTEKKLVKRGVLLFTLQLFFNFLWSIVFFGMHAPRLGLIDIILLLTLIVMTIVEFYRISKPAAYLLIPYLAWVSFATLLNFSIVLLNP